jgi:MFS family permease
VTEAAQAPTQLAAATIDGKPISDKYRFYILILLAASFGLNMADRGLISTVMPAIKAEMHLTDTEVGFIAGPMFAFVYAAFGIPLATLADQRNRRTLIAFTTTVFSAATALSGFANSYVHLAMCRFLTGAGEAGTTPTGNSMIADLYPPEKRAFALSVYTAGGSAGGLLTALIGGVVAHNYGWRIAFFAAGVPGALLAILILATTVEPRRKVSKLLSAQNNAVPMMAVLKQLWSQRAFRWMVAADSIMVFHGRGSGTFTNLFLVQTHHLNLQQIGVIQTSFGLIGMAATVLLGKLIDRLSVRNIRHIMYFPSLVAILAVPFTLVMLLAPSTSVAVIAWGLGAVFGGAYLAPVFAATQALAPNSMRARAVAVLLLIITLIGMGFGPLSTGILSDVIGARVGEADGLRWSLIILLIPNLFACAFFYRAAKWLPEGISRAKAMDGELSAAS